MNNRTNSLEQAVVGEAMRCGADLAGIADAGALRRSPSYQMLPQLDHYDGVGTLHTKDKRFEEVAWPEEAASFVVICLAHSSQVPELDWWSADVSGGTEGNRRLIEITRCLAEWLADEHGIEASSIPYHIERGGVFLKDAAVLAGLGCLGRNNMLITPEFGPRVRLRALALPVALAATGPSSFDPCEGCPEPCRDPCPEDAFGHRLYEPEVYGLEELPARSGVYDRTACNVRMEADKAQAGGLGTPGATVRWCRRCEFACVRGREE